MTVLQDYQFELDGYVFGLDCPIFVDAEGFDPGEPQWLDQDQVNPLTGATMMGRDVRGASPWTFAMHVNTETPEDALAELAKIGAKWANGSVGWRETGKVTSLRYCIGGRTRRVYGRPRRFSAKPGNKVMGGYLPPLATFERADSLHYDDAPSSIDMFLMASGPAGGIEFPLAFPMVVETDPTFETPWAVVVGGDAPTGVVITFTGPVTDPKLVIGDFKMGFTGFLPEGSSITVDTRPFSTTIQRSGAAGSLALTRDTRLTRGVLMPGAYDALFTGTDTSGGARCQVIWHNAWHTL